MVLSKFSGDNKIGVAADYLNDKIRIKKMTLKIGKMAQN